MATSKPRQKSKTTSNPKRAVSPRKKKILSKKETASAKQTHEISLLKKFHGNPIVEPHPSRPWESKATFNPAALYEDGRVHILYRAIGDSDMSVLGYASSADGLHIDERHESPAYVPRESFEGVARPASVTEPVSTFISGGGGWGGVEDPRMTKIDGRVYMTYVAFNGWEPPRVALTSIPIEDFLTKQWHKWSKSFLISPPGVVDKNAVIFPEKINGKYVIMHRIYPDILIDFVDDLDFDGKTKWLRPQHKITPRAPHFWDSHKIGAGAPPIKTEKGWLLIYQAVGKRDRSRYKIGAMLLDLKDPTHVLARSKQPILEPKEQYENWGWKFGVVYPCGAVVIKDKLFVYYGGADRVTCVASAPLNEFLEELIKDKEPKLRKEKIK